MFESMKQGMANTRTKFTEQMNILFDRGPKVDEEFWDGLEEALILSDVGAQAAFDIVSRMRDTATRKALPDAYAVMDALTEEIAATFATSEVNIFDENPVLVLFVGINGAGKTTTVGKIANAAKRAGRKVLLGSADTFRAAAIEQLEEWGRRSDVEIVQRERGADPASVCYDTIERAEATGANFVLIDTAGRLHTSDDLMRELGKVVTVVRKRSNIPVRVVLVIDATTGQNGLSQARLFNKELDLDALIVTKLDGTAKGGIALAVSHELNLPIAMIGVGEGLTDLQVFEPEEFAAALIGAEPVEEAMETIAEPAETSPALEEMPTQEVAVAEENFVEDLPAQEPVQELAESGSFSWKDDFGNPDEMVDALGAQRELVVVTEPAETVSESAYGAAGDVSETADDAAEDHDYVQEAAPSTEDAIEEAACEPEETSAEPDEAQAVEDEPKKQESVFKRAWRWLSE